jgi:hypothetical protein
MLGTLKPGTATSSISGISLSNLGPVWEPGRRLPANSMPVDEAVTQMRGGVGITVLMIDGNGSKAHGITSN